jgi:predicted amidohydrolase
MTSSFLLSLPIFAITADRVGEEGRIPEEKLTFIGQSQVVDPDGNILIRASETAEDVHIIEIDLEKARDKYLNAKNEIFKDRRPDLYLAMISLDIVK